MEPKEIFIPLSLWETHYQWPTVAGMRMRYRNRKVNGYESAFCKEGKRVIVRVNEFWKCLEKRGEKK
jgi:hypothetical protein